MLLAHCQTLTSPLAGVRDGAGNVTWSKWEKNVNFKGPFPLEDTGVTISQDAFLWSQMQENLRMLLRALGMFHLEINLSDCRVPWALVEVLDVESGAGD